MSPEHPLHLDELTLRPWQPTDLPALEAVAGRLGPWMTWQPTAFLDRALRNWATGKSYNYAILTTGHPTPIGNACLITTENATELAYWLHPDHTGRGIATRATRALLDQARRIGAPHVDLRHHPDNTRSAALAARLGFQPLGQHGTELLWRHRLLTSQP
ncbi:GNAT family N-acetyltransferase [Kutzneria viridogrisea]|uniref:N-acetyltransferase domain-containing protein n=2 Tax=Kutzneria TaxID=43356 RepID=W5WB19_9PSEU|nr:GNAT family N-acetyltransferase [Kutzneria albida]AHH97706.1 hypothetical protein KALB_4344 [Kutzneria albida DSM 43870]MBA8924706.1 RimJ/RimL family protein N-acetyltransferase [Kutzneria viridogrisea]